MDKKEFKRIVKSKFSWFFRVRDCFNTFKGLFFNNTNPKVFGAFGKNTIVQTPCSISDTSLIYLEDYVGIRKNFSFDGYGGKLIVKKYTKIGRNCTIVTSNHVKTVGLPQFFSSMFHVNDRCSDVEIGEDVWIGANCTILPKSKIGRGSIVGACSLVNKEIPPYAVVVGSPCKIIGSTYTIDQIIKHEAYLYPEEERFSRPFLEDLFKKYYIDKKSFGQDCLTEEQIADIRNRI